MPDTESYSQAPRRKPTRADSWICAKSSILLNIIYFIDTSFYESNYLNVLMSPKSKSLTDFFECHISNHPQRLLYQLLPGQLQTIASSLFCTPKLGGVIKHAFDHHLPLKCLQGFLYPNNAQSIVPEPLMVTETLQERL